MCLKYKTAAIRQSWASWDLLTAGKHPQQVTRNTCPNPSNPKGIQAMQPQGQNKTSSTGWRLKTAQHRVGLEMPVRETLSTARASLQLGLQWILRELGYKHLYKYQRQWNVTPRVHRTSSDKLLHKVQGGMHINRRSNNKMERNKTFIPVTREALSTFFSDFCNLRQSLHACG